MKPAGAQEEDVQVLVERPYSHEGPHHPHPYSSRPTVCTATQREDTLTLLCEGSGRNRTYLIAGASQDRINDLCNQLCT